MYTFVSNNEGYFIYMGNDKFENEKLIRWGWPEDVWFHVDDYSSAHVYVRLPTGVSFQSIPESVLEECAQLTKANSIEGSKKASVDIVYTPWANLRKDESSMDTGTIGFKDHKKVFKLRSVARDREMINRLEKTRQQVSIDFEATRLKRDREELGKQKQHRMQELLTKQQQEEQERHTYRLKHYVDLKVGETNQIKGDGTVESCRKMEEDFM